MRDIKFRAWDGEEMQHDIGIANNHAFDYDHESAWPWHQPAEAIMQFTGLSDKNGVEIFESDILRCETENYQGVVWFGAGSFLTDCEGFGDHPLGETNSGDIEVIGNIFQNPDLLEDV